MSQPACESHSYSDASARSKLSFAIAVTLVILAVEILGGWWTNSLALLSDAAHVFADLLSLVMSLVALRLALRPPGNTRTFGWHRTEVFAAMINGFTLIVISLGIFREAYHRFLDPPEVRSTEMLVIATVGMLANLLVMLRLGNHHHDLNLRSAFLHVLGDFLASIGVILGGVVMSVTGWYAADPIVSALIGLTILGGSVRLILEASHILLEGVPRGIKLDVVAEAMRSVEGVQAVHQLRVWSLCSHILALSSHVTIENDAKSKRPEIVRAINEQLEQRFHITETTLQLDCNGCDPNELVPALEHANGNNHAHA